MYISIYMVYIYIYIYMYGIYMGYHMCVYITPASGYYCSAVKNVFGLGSEKITLKIFTAKGNCITETEAAQSLRHSVKKDMRLNLFPARSATNFHLAQNKCLSKHFPPPLPAPPAAPHRPPSSSSLRPPPSSLSLPPPPPLSSLLLTALTWLLSPIE